MLKRKIAMATLALIPLTATNAFASNQEGIVTATSLNVRSGPSTGHSVIFMVKKNEKVTILQSDNGWYKISAANGKSGWVSSEYISTNISNTNQSTNKKIVNVNNLNMRSGASTSYRVIAKLSKGSIVELISENNGWAKIKYDGRLGYVSSEFLSNIDNNIPDKKTETPSETLPDTVITKIKVVTATSLNVRSGPSTSNALIGSLRNNEKVEVISENNGWAKIKYSGRLGYVSSVYLKDAGDNNTNTNPNPGEKPNEGAVKTKVVTATSLNVRSGPSTSHGLIGTLKHNERVEVISESNGWSKIKYKGKEAYVSSDYLKDAGDSNTNTNPNPGEKPNEGTVKTKVVTATSLNVRSGPSTSHGLIGTLKHNEKIEVISESNGWSKIKYNGKEAYVSSTYLKDYNGDVGSGGDSSEIVNGATVNYKNENHSLQDHTNKQLSKVNMIASSSGGFVHASRSDVEHYLNPNNFKDGKKGMLQFLRLDSYKGGITSGELNGYLNSLRPASSGTNVFYNQGQAFINAARKYNIDLSYLVAHSMLETGYGRSTLAQGQVLTSYKGNPLPQPVKVYNFFGIGAFDGTANLSGAEAAYKNGWTSVEKTIEGSARWISSNYIHNGNYSQNTLYKMRWSYDYLHHQYATDVNWANAISGIMYKFIGMYDTNSNLIFEIPVHR